MKKARLPAMDAQRKDRGNLQPKRRTKGTFATAVLFILTTASGLSAFDVVLATSFDGNFPDKWTHTPAGAAPYLSNRDTVYVGIPWRIHSFFKEYALDYSGNADMSLSYQIRKPDGSLFFDTTGIQALSGMVRNKDALQLSYRIPIVLFTRKDAPGNYKLIVTVEDRVAHTKQTKEKQIIVANYPKAAPGDFTDISFNVWVHSYCLDPDPGRAISAFSHFINSKMSDNNDIFWPVFYFFQCLFNDNPALITKLAGIIPKCSDRLREYTVFLFRAIQCKKSDIGYPVPDSLWEKFDRAAAAGFCDPFTDALLLKSNRLMESGFYYHGNYSMIQYLIECLGVTTPAGYASFLRNCNKYSNKCSNSMDKETARQFSIEAKSILAKTYAKHPLVNAYCNFALENDIPEVDARKALLEIVAASKK